MNATLFPLGDPMHDPLAHFSPDRVYRYKLERRNLLPRPTGTVCFILLNPSTADETQDDPTIRRCIGYAKAWGWSRLVVLNLFGFRATKPADLKKASDPFGPENMRFIRSAVMAADCVVTAWGAHGSFHNQGQMMFWRLRDWGVEPKALGFTKGGQPVHPLYQRADAELVPA